MAERNFKINYDKEEDIFSIFVIGNRVKFSFDLELPQGDIVIDFGFNGQIVGIEFFNASNYFPMLKNANEKDIKARMSVQYGRNWAQISYEISIKGKKPVSSQYVIPYNRKLIAAH